MRYITKFIKKYIVPIQIIGYIIFFLIVFFALRCDSQNYRQEKERKDAATQQLQSDKATLQQDNAALRAEIDRMREESSRSGGRRMMEITAYTANDCGKQPGHPEYGITAYGNRLTEADAYRVVAADPLYYPAGTKMHINGIGKVVVRDTGGAIKGRDRLDLFVGMTNISEANKWGRRNVQVVIER